ncbi:MAG: hypothetical protein ACK4TA_24330, partial [Saprospiraceae bacterium]
MKNIRKIWLALVLVLLGATLQAQILNPVSWSTSYKQVNNNEFDLIFTATIDEGWTIYSQYLESDEGPVATSFHFDKGDHFELIGKNKESGNIKKAYDNTFGMNLTKISKKGVFTQRVRVKDFSKPIVGYLEFMTCDDERCLPPTEEEFSFELVADKSKTTTEKTPSASELPNAQTPKSTTITPQPVEEPALIQPSLTPKGGILDPVKWTGEIRKISDTEFELIYHARMDEGWYIYS